MIAITAAIAGLDVFVWFSSDRTALEGYASFVVSIGVPAITLSVFVVKRRRVKTRPLNYLSDELEAEVKAQWTKAAAERKLLLRHIPVRWERSSQVDSWSAAAVAGSKGFAPFPGIRRTGKRQLKGGDIDDLHRVYGGLGSGRLLIVGSPGSGKSGTAVLFTLAAISHREKLRNERGNWREVPVPVLLTFHGWDPNESVEHWLAKRLQQTYPSLFPAIRGVAECASLVREARVTVILDGLDEIPDELQRTAMTDLSEQATFRIIVLTRNTGMNAAVASGVFAGAVALELREVDPRTAKDYLKSVMPDRLPDRWRELLDTLSASTSALAAALNKPLTLTLVRDIYPDGDVGELLDFTDAHPLTLLPALKMSKTICWIVSCPPLTGGTLASSRYAMTWIRLNVS